MSADARGKVIRALENGQFKWRTVDGIASEIKEPKARVVETIKDLSRQGVVVNHGGSFIHHTKALPTNHIHRQTVNCCI